MKSENNKKICEILNCMERMGITCTCSERNAKGNIDTYWCEGDRIDITFKFKER